MKWIFKKPSLITRLCARIFDYTLFYLLGCLALMLSPWGMDDRTFLTLLAITPFSWLLLDALFIKWKGSTPGRFLFGYRFEEEGRSKVSWKMAAFHISKLNYMSRKKSRMQTLLAFLVLGAVLSPFMFEDELKSNAQRTLSYFQKDKNIIHVNWLAFKPDNATFEINFPKKPEIDERTLPVPDSEALPYYEFKSPYNEEIVYSVCYTILPQDWLKWSSSLVLGGALKVINKHIGQSKTLHKSSQKYNKQPGLNFIVKRGDKEVAGALILSGNHLYKVEVSYPPELRLANAHNLDAFLSSFTPYLVQR